MRPIIVSDIPSLNSVIAGHFYIDTYDTKEGICFVTVNEEGCFTNTILRAHVIKNDFCKMMVHYNKKIASTQSTSEGVVEIKFEDTETIFYLKIAQLREIIDVVKTKITFNNPNLDQLQETFEKRGEKVLLLKSEDKGIVLDGLVGELEMSTFERDGYKIHLINTDDGSILLQSWENK